MSFTPILNLQRLDAAGLTGKVVHLLERYGLDYKNNLIGQAYDGAAVMSCKHSGVQARIKEQAKFVFFIHCSGRCLFLVHIWLHQLTLQRIFFFCYRVFIYFYFFLTCAPKMAVSSQRNIWQNKRAGALQHFFSDWNVGFSFSFNCIKSSSWFVSQLIHNHLKTTWWTNIES